MWVNDRRRCTFVLHEGMNIARPVGALSDSQQDLDIQRHLIKTHGSHLTEPVCSQLPYHETALHADCENEKCEIKLHS